MNILEMIDDYIKRAKYPMTQEEVLSDMKTGMCFVEDEGFLVLGGHYKNLHVIHGYIKPGNKELFKKFIKITTITAKFFGCDSILFTTMRSKGFTKLMAREGCYPMEAVIFKKAVV